MKDRSICLSVAGSDSGGEAGIQADLQAFNFFNVHGLSVVTALTAQNPSGIVSLNIQASQVVADQLLACLSYFDIDCIKLGMLANSDIVQIVLDKLPLDIPIVLDPVLISTSGKVLLDDCGVKLLEDSLLPRVSICTPNLHEAQYLLNSKSEDVKFLAESFYKKFNVPVLLKGGHSSHKGRDFLMCDTGMWQLDTPELKAPANHGTGCRLSSAICANIANGHDLLASSIGAKNYLYASLKNYSCTKKGQPVMTAQKDLEKLVISQKISP